MASSRDVRRLALVLLYQLDARGPEDVAGVLSLTDSWSAESEIGGADAGLLLGDEGVGLFREAEAEPFTPRDGRRAAALARAAYENREAADREMAELAPEWPTHRLAAIDRAILRLAHAEMTSGMTPPKVAVNEAVELAKDFSTEKSPAFVNGLLGKVLKRVQGTAAAEALPAAEPVPAPETVDRA